MKTTTETMKTTETQWKPNNNNKKTTINIITKNNYKSKDSSLIHVWTLWFIESLMKTINFIEKTSGAFVDSHVGSLNHRILSETKNAGSLIHRIFYQTGQISLKKPIQRKMKPINFIMKQIQILFIKPGKIINSYVARSLIRKWALWFIRGSLIQTVS